jgi:hypothetical protein
VHLGIFKALVDGYRRSPAAHSYSSADTDDASRPSYSAQCQIEQKRPDDLYRFSSSL